MTCEELITRAAKVLDKSNGVFCDTCEIISDCLANCDINLFPHNKFFVDIDVESVKRYVKNRRFLPIIEKVRSSDLYRGERAYAYSGAYDFGHSSPDWESVISLGIVGLRNRIVECADKNTSPETKDFYTSIISLYDAEIDFLGRVSDLAEKNSRRDMAEGLRALTRRAPQTLFEAMQMTLVYYHFQQKFEGSILRTLGRLDWLYYEFYKKETSAAHARELVRDFLLEINELRFGRANIPFVLGASMNGEPSNELTEMFLDVYREIDANDIKMQLLVREDTPDSVLKKAFSAIREGKNSIIFMSEEKIFESLCHLGEATEDARSFHVVGCYECGGRGEITCSCNARVNLPKALEYAINGGVDMLTGEQIGLKNEGAFDSFDSFFGEYVRQMTYLADCGMRLTEEYERRYPEMLAAPVLSSTYPTAIKRGADIYMNSGAKYNNSSINALGLATATDSLVAIKKLVFDDKVLTIEALCDILKKNWQGSETLRLRVKNRFPKYGTANDEADSIAAEIVDLLADSVEGRPNARGGVWRLGTFSIDWRWNFGRHTAASACGRLSGETLSQNASAAFGADREGYSAHLISASRLNTERTPNGTVVDLDIHYSAVSGESGLAALVAALRTFVKMGGFAVHYNVLNVETLKAARLRPDDYPTLQVRVCGWNAPFASLSDKEKDEFIKRFEEKAV